MPWMTDSRAPSPSLGSGSPQPAMRAKPQQPAPISYIPPLIDGACGTVPQGASQTTAMATLKADAQILISIGTTLARDLYRTLMFHRRETSWREMIELAVQAALCAFELYVLGWAIPLWVLLPGSFFVGWSVFCAAVVMGASSMLNKKERVIRQDAPTRTDGVWQTGAVGEERWIYMGGLGVSTNALSRTTLPRLAALFNRPITAIPTPTHGLVFDVLQLLLQRALPLPTTPTHTLYNELRTALLTPSLSKVVLLASSTGTIAASRALAQLYADFPTDKLARLEVYTFGSLAVDFAMPLGGDPHKAMMSPTPGAAPPSPPLENAGVNGHQQPQTSGPHLTTDRREPHIEHFSHTADALATHLGIVRSVRTALSARYCGGVFVLSGQPCHRSCTGRPAPAVLGIESYLECLFPSQMTGKGGPNSILDATMTIERDVAEKREFAAMASFQSSTARVGADGNKRKRLSWTGLGATAGSGRVNGVVMDGAWGLEMARRGCRDCDGHKGREVSWLARYVKGRESEMKNGQVNGGLGMSSYGGEFRTEGSMMM